MKNYIIILCIFDFLFTILGMEIGYLSEANPVLDFIFSQQYGYTIGFIFKMILTILGINFLDKHNFLGYINFCLCLYLSINALHIFYVALHYLNF